MGMPSADVVERRVRENASYRRDFARAFGADNPITLDRIAEAIAAYERTLITPDSPYDRFVRGDGKALDAAQLRGMALFESLGCVSCHRGPNFSDASLLGGQSPLRIFPAQDSPFDARYRLTADGGGAGRSGPGVWRVPSLRNIALTGPYFHNGSVDTLGEAVRVMANAQLGIAVGSRSTRAPYWSPKERVLSQAEHRAIGEGDVDDIVAFLNGLSSDTLAQRKGKK
jgi:cytochrome c peroxidase